MLSKIARYLPIFVILFAFTAPAFAQNIPPAKNFGTSVQACSGGSTAVLAADDLKQGRRDYLMVQCTGAADCYCCLGTGANGCTVVNGTFLAKGGVGSEVFIPLSPQNGFIVPVPIADVACCGSGGTSNVSGVDW